MAEKSNQDIIVNELLRLIPISYIMSDGFATACTNSRYQFIWNYTHLYLLSVNIMDVRTEEQKAEEEIRNNLSEQGIDVRNLFKSNIKTTFLHTEPEKSKELKNQDSFNLLLSRIKEE